MTTFFKTNLFLNSFPNIFTPVSFFVLGQTFVIQTLVFF